MLKLIDKYTLIKLKENNYSNREVASVMGIDRKTVGSYWSDYLSKVSDLGVKENDIHLVQRQIVESKTYDSTNRKRKKYTYEIDQELNQILESELKKDETLGKHKQKLSCEQIHSQLVSMGYDIGLTTITAEVSKKRNSKKECFIKQEYDYGDRLEYDFGEAKVVLGEMLQNISMAVMASPAGDFQWCYLYKTQGKDVFMDSHVRFFEMTGGPYNELVYDNMRNVVKKFIGRNEKELNPDLIKMSLYYGFKINVTNCFSGNEKGTVESAVKRLRNQLFATKYEFASFDEMESYVEQELIRINANSKIEEEKKYLLPYKPKLELAKISNAKVNKYSCVRVENNFYSVPEHLVNKTVIVHNYLNQLIIFINNEKVAEHKKIDGFEQYKIDIMHYLSTFTKKPGALKNSRALKSIPKLKTIYDTYFITQPRKFVEILLNLQNKEIDKILINIETIVKSPMPINSIDLIDTNIENNVTIITQQQVAKLSQIYKIGDSKHAN